MKTRVFTTDEACEMLVVIKPLVETIMVDAKRYNSAMYEARTYGRDDSAKSANEISENIRKNAEKLLERGVFLKDAFIGLVDFPSIIGGKLVYLCWKYGESTIEYYHELEAGYAGRRRIPN